jgi:hypothetical protein
MKRRRVTQRTAERLYRLAYEIEWLQGRLRSEGFDHAADCLYHAKKGAHTAGERLEAQLKGQRSE